MSTLRATLFGTSSERKARGLYWQRPYTIGLAIGAMVMTFFGTIWWGMTTGAVQSLLPTATLPFELTVAIVMVALFSLSCLALLKARQLPRATSQEERAQGAITGKRYGRIFGLVFGLEIVIISVGNSLLYATHHADFSMPFMAIVVGIHFLPLAPLFKARYYYATAILLTLIGAVTLLVVPQSLTFGHARAWDIITGFGCGSVLWLTAIAALVTARAYIRN